MKPPKEAISFVIKNEEGQILIVRRPDNDEDLPGAWGLPAGSLKPGETYKDAVKRSGKEKLNLEVEVKDELKEGEIERDTYVLHMKLYEAGIKEGNPSVQQDHPEVTQYTGWKWSDIEDLKPAAREGSLCCRLYLQNQGEVW